MGEVEVEQGGSLWEEEEEEQSWAFPNLASPQQDSATKDKEPPPPPPSPPSKGKKRSAAAAAAAAREADDHELHIWTERERRKKMRNMFSNLHALLPHIPPKADKSTIVDEAVNHIKKLQQTLEELEKRKAEKGAKDTSLFVTHKLTVQSREAFIAEYGASSSSGVGPNPLFLEPEYPALFKTWNSPNVILNVCGREAHISVCSMRKPGLLTALLFVMEKNNFEVVSAQASSDRTRSMFMIHARAMGGSEHFQQGFPIEEIFKQAALEIMMFVNS